MKTLIKHSRVIDPAHNMDKTLDILIENTKITRVAENILEPNATLVEAKGLVAMPGFIDMHTHARQPGQEYKEDFSTITRAAIKGGFTSICTMPNTIPAIDTPSSIEYVKTEANKLGRCHVYPIGCITVKREGKALVEMADLKNAGAIALSDDGSAVPQASVLYKALLYAKTFDMLIIEHCEDKDLAQDGVMNEGFVSTKLGLKGIPRIAESIIVERDIQIAEYTHTRIHLAHISTQESVDAIRRAKQRGVLITAETAPHYFSLTEEEVLGYNTYAKVNPPLRVREDVLAIKKALKEGVIDCIATDHAPHLDIDKRVEFEYASFGMIGLQTAFSQSFSQLCEAEHFSLIELARLLSYNPARILGLSQKGSLAEGQDADITLIDLKKEWLLSRDILESKSNNTPLLGRTMQGVIHSVFVNGNTILKAGQFI